MSTQNPAAPNALDRALSYFAPVWASKRQRARIEADLRVRHYEAASGGRRTSGWRATSSDATASMRDALSKLRNNARDLVRNNPHATSALDVIADHVVGWGIVAKPSDGNTRAAEAWDRWASTPACDADGRLDFYGLQKLAQRTITESGEVLVRQRIRRLGDTDSMGKPLPLPLQIQVFEPDYIDTLKTGITLPNGGRIVAGIEYDFLGRRVAYWLFPEHPGSEIFGGATTSRRIPAQGILHVFRTLRPGQGRGASWFSPVILKMRDFDEYDDAQLMKQKVAALLGVVVTDIDGTARPFGSTDSAQPTWDYLEPGGIHHVGPGTEVDVIQPARVAEFRDYAGVTLRTIAAGLGISYEDMAGDYDGLPFSAARMSRIRHWARVEDWRWQTLIPQLCAPVWSWVMQTAAVVGQVPAEIGPATWTAQPPPMLDPTSEATAYRDLVRGGFLSWSEAIRERGYDPKAVLAEIAKDFGAIESLGIVLDSNPKQVSAAGLVQSVDPTAPKPAPGDGSPSTPVADGGDDEGEDEDREERTRLIAAIASHVQATMALAGRPVPDIHVDARVMEGAVQVNTPAVTVDARTTIEPGAVLVETNVGGAPSGRELLEAVAADESLPEDDSLTPRQREVLGQVRELVREHKARLGEAPSLALLARAMRLDRKTLREHLQVLYERGEIKSPTPGGVQ